MVLSMTERLPKNCSLLLENLAKSIGEDSQLGVGIDVSASGKNRFQLKACFCSSLKMYYLTVDYNVIIVPGIANLFNAIYPDFLLKKTAFMPLSRLICEFKLDKEMLACEIMKMIRAKLKEALKYHQKEGASINLLTNRYVSKNTDDEVTPKFKSFSEFLVWSDLNVK